MIIELGKLLNEVKTHTVTTEKGDNLVLNKRFMIYQVKLKNKEITVDNKTFQGFYILVDNARIVFGKTPNELAQEAE